LPNVGPYIYDVSISGFTRSSIYIYDISSLRVNYVVMKHSDTFAYTNNLLPMINTIPGVKSPVGVIMLNNTVTSKLGQTQRGVLFLPSTSQNSTVNLAN